MSGPCGGLPGQAAFTLTPSPECPRPGRGLGNSCLAAAGPARGCGAAGAQRPEAGPPPRKASAPAARPPAAAPPPPTLSVRGESADVLRPGGKVSLGCAAPLEGVEFQLRSGGRELKVSRWSTTPGRVHFDLEWPAPGQGGRFTCRYHLRGERMPWSADSAPVELLLSDGEPRAAPSERGGTQGRAPGLQGSGQANPDQCAGPSFPAEREAMSSATSWPHEHLGRRSCGTGQADATCPGTPACRGLGLGLQDLPRTRTGSVSSGTIPPSG